METATLATTDFSYAILPWLLVALLYIEAGRRTWQNLFLRLPERSDEPLAKMVKTNSVPLWGLIIWYLAWAPIMLIGWALSRYQLYAESRGQGSFLDLQ